MTAVEIINDIRLKVGEFEWKVPQKLITKLSDGSEFLTINPRDYGLIKVICTGVIDGIKPYVYTDDAWTSNFSLVHTKGYKELRKLRNEAQRALLLSDESNEHKHRVADLLDDDLCSHSDDEDTFEPAAKKRRGFSRMTKGTVTVDLGEHSSVIMMSPTAANANMKVELTEQAISTVIDFLRVDLDRLDLLSKRTYTKRQPGEGAGGAPPPSTEPLDAPPALPSAAGPNHFGAASGQASPSTPPRAFGTSWENAVGTFDRVPKM